MGIMPADKLTELRVALSAAFEGGLPGLPRQGDRLVMTVPARTETLTYDVLGQWPTVRQWIGDKQYKSLREKAYQISDLAWEASIEVPRKAFEDDNLGLYITMAKNYSSATAQFLDREIFACLEAGTSALCYDGLPFFSASHPIGDDGETATSTESNINTAGSVNAWYLFDLRQAGKPLIVQERKPFQFVAMDTETDEHVFTRGVYRYSIDARYGFGYGFWQMAYRSTATLNETNYRAAKAAMRALTDDKGNKLGIKPTLLVYGSSNAAAAEALIKAQLTSDGDSNVLYNDIELLDCDWIA
jgi:phage major head subunit gpT-like protein